MLKLRLAAALGLAQGPALAQAGAAATPTATVVSLDAEQVLAALHLNANDVTFVSAIADEAPGNWRTGVTGRVRRGDFVLSPTGQPTAARGLKLSISGLGANIHAETCDGNPDGWQCAPVEGAAAGAGRDYSLGAGAWHLQTYGSVCSGEGSCALYIPSWSLANQLTGAGGVSYPTLTAVIGYKGGVCLYDVNRRAVFSCTSTGGPAFAQLGALSRVYAPRSGVLALSYEHGVIVLDYKDDTAYIVTAHGVESADAGVAAAGEAAFAETYAKPDGRAGDVLAVTSDAVVWTDGVLHWAPGQALRKAAFESLSSASRVAVSAPANGKFATVRVLRSEAAGAVITELTASGNTDVLRLANPPANADLSGLTLIYPGDGGLHARGSDGDVLTAAMGSVDTRVWLPSASLFVRSGEGSSCQWAYFHASADRGSSLVSDGQATACGTLTGFGASPSGDASASMADHQLQIVVHH